MERLSNRLESLSQQLLIDVVISLLDTLAAQIPANLPAAQTAEFRARLKNQRKYINTLRQAFDLEEVGRQVQHPLEGLDATLRGRMGATRMQLVAGGQLHWLKRHALLRAGRCIGNFLADFGYVTM